MSDQGQDFEPEPVLPFIEEGELPSFLQTGMQNKEEPVIEQTDETTFNDEISEDVSGLLHLGYLTGSFEVLGHTFVLRTLTLAEELAVGQIVNDYAATVVQGQAFAAALVAASIVTVDGRELMSALGPSEERTIRERFEYVTKNWYWGTVEQAHQRYGELLKRQNTAYLRVLDLSQASREPSTP